MQRKRNNNEKTKTKTKKDRTKKVTGTMQDLYHVPLV